MNRDPLPSEIELYSPFLWRQINIIKPEIIATLGRYSMKFIFEKFCLPYQSISKVHGQTFETEASYGKIKIIPLFHPAVALYRAETKKEIEEDFQTFKKLK